MKKFCQGHNIHTLQHAKIGNHSIYRLHSAEHANIPHTMKKTPKRRKNINKKI